MYITAAGAWAATTVALGLLRKLRAARIPKPDGR